MLPLLYLHGLSCGDFVPALGEFLGSTAGLSGPVITKLTETWKAEQRAFLAATYTRVSHSRAHHDCRPYGACGVASGQSRMAWWRK